MKTAILLVISSLVLGFTPVEEENVPLEMMAMMAGEWETEYEFPGYGEVSEEATYTFGETNSILISDVKVYSAGELVDHSTGTFWYNEETATFHAESTGANGAMKSTSESIEWTEESILLEGNFEGENAPFDLHRVQITIVDKDTINVTLMVPEGENWNEILNVTYTRTE